MTTKRYIHHISVPITGSVIASVESDEEHPSPRTLHDLFCELHWRLRIESKDGVELGEELRTHESVIDGSFSNAALNELTLDDTEEDE